MGTLHIISRMSGVFLFAVCFVFILTNPKRFKGSLLAFAFFLALVVVIEGLAFFKVLLFVNKNTLEMLNCYLLIESILIFNILVSWIKVNGLGLRVSGSMVLALAWLVFYPEDGSLTYEFLLWEYLMVGILSIVALYEKGLRFTVEALVCIGFLTYSITTCVNVIMPEYSQVLNWYGNMTKNAFFLIALVRTGKDRGLEVSESKN